MPANKVLTVILAAILALLGDPAARAQSPLAQEAQQKAAAGDYRAAVDLYEKAIASGTSQREKDHLTKDLETVKKTYYVELAREAQNFNSSQAEKVEILGEAYALDIEGRLQDGGNRGGLRGLRGKGDEDFRKAVLEVRTLRLKMFTELRKDAASAARERDLARALTALEQAYTLDPEQFVQHRLDQAHELVKERIGRGEKLALEGHRLLEQGQYAEAQEQLKLADSVYPGQKSVQDDLARIQNSELEYELVLGEADAAAATGDAEKARQGYQQALGLAPGRAREDGVQGRLTRLDAPPVGNPFEEAMAHFRASRFTEARDGFEKALELDSSNTEARQYLARADSMALLLEGKEHAQANEFERAEKAFDMAVTRYRDNQEAARLLDRSQTYRTLVREGRALYRSGNCEQSKKQLLAARNLDSKRFSLDALEVILNEDCTPPAARAEAAPRETAPRRIPLPTAQVRRGLLALFDGRVEESIQILEAVLEDVGEGHAKLHAFLGAAYSHAALMSLESDVSGLNRAREQFQLVLTLEPDYQLADSLFSPRILGILEEVRGSPQ